MCVYSTQASLAYIISSKGKIALVNDIISSSGEFRNRYICIFEGDGYDRLKPFSAEEVAGITALDECEPIIVFGGYVLSDTLDAQSLSQLLNSWLDNFPRLMLACDVFYPQFPQVKDDPDFNNSPIIPQEDLLKKLIYTHSMVNGVSATDPSLFCSSHTYPASLGQVLKSLREKNASGLPSCFHSMQIPHAEMWGIKMYNVLS